MVNKIESRGVLQYGDVIEDRSEVHISIDVNNLPTPDNLLVPEAGEQAAHRICNGEFGHNSLCRRSMDNSSNSRPDILPSTGVNFIPFCLNIF